MKQVQSATVDAKPLRWIESAIAILLIALLSNLSLYPEPTSENVLIALRITSLTTALPLLLVAIARPLALVSRPWADWTQTYCRELWLVLTASHLVHLYQIGIYYQLGQQCPLVIWLLTVPVWGITILFSIVAIARPQWLKQPPSLGLKRLYGLGLGYVWAVFTMAFGLGAIARHLPFYNIPAFLLFLSGGALHLVAIRRKT